MQVPIARERARKLDPLPRNTSAETAATAPLHGKQHRDIVGRASMQPPLLKNVKMGAKPREFSLDDSVTAAGSTASSTGSAWWLSGPSVVLPPPHAPKSLDNTERILYLVQQYVRGSFDARKWAFESHVTVPLQRHARGEASLSALNNFYSLYISAHRTMLSPKLESFTSASHLIDKANANVRQIITDQHPNTLLQLFSVVVRFADSSPIPEIPAMTLQYFSEMATVILGKHHPLSEIAECLGYVEQSVLVTTISQAWEILAASFEEQLGASHHVSLNCRLRMIDSIFAKPSTLQNAEALLRKLLKTSTDARASLDLGSASIEYSLARLLLLQGRHVECLSVASSVIKCCQTLYKSDEYRAAALQSSALHLGAAANHQMGQHDMAESCLRQHAQLRASTWGQQSPLTLHALLSLEEFLTTVKKQEDARRVKKLRLNITAQLDDPD
jgi:hypothetical protein